MKEDPFLGEYSLFGNSKIPVWEMLVPVFILGLVLVADLLFVHMATITPLACAALISWIAIRNTPRVVGLWAVICICATAALLFHDTKYLTFQSPQLTALLRTASTAFTVGLAVAISMYRRHLTHSYQQAIRVLEKMPIPIIVSDETGTINFVNDKAAVLLGLKTEEAPGYSYFSLLANQYEKGRSIQHYLKIFDSYEEEGIKQPIQLRRHPNKLVSGLLMGMGHGQNRRLVTVLIEGPEIPPGSLMPLLR